MTSNEAESIFCAMYNITTFPAHNKPEEHGPLTTKFDVTTQSYYYWHC